MSDLVDGLPSLDDVSTMIGALLDPDCTDDSIRDWYAAARPGATAEDSAPPRRDSAPPRRDSAPPRRGSAPPRRDISSADISAARTACRQHRVPGRRTGGALNHACNVYLTGFVRAWIRQRRPAWTPAEVDSSMRWTLDAGVLAQFTASVSNLVIESLRRTTDLDFARTWRDAVASVAEAPHFLAVRLGLQHVARECFRSATARAHAEIVPKTPSPAQTSAPA